LGNDLDGKGPIPFNRPTITGAEKALVQEVFDRGKFGGSGPAVKACNQWLTNQFSVQSLVTTSGSHALEMAAILCDLDPGDEVILPSFTFPTSATAFVRCGARVVFVDVEPTTMNIDPDAVIRAITERTRALVVVHYAGVACDMNRLLEIAKSHRLLLVEDAAHAIFARYNHRWCGTMGDLSCFSFHETKNLQCGEGGALLIPRADLAERAEIIWEKGTNRRHFNQGLVDKYSWHDIGSSYAMSELNAAFLMGQLQHHTSIIDDRVSVWKAYYEQLDSLAAAGHIELPHVPSACDHNGHIFWIKVKDEDERRALIDHLRQNEVQAVFHYVPLHSSVAGQRFGRFSGGDHYTTAESSRLLRLPLYYGFAGVDRVCGLIDRFYS